jgi:hypothetical protein
MRLLRLVEMLSRHPGEGSRIGRINEFLVYPLLIWLFHLTPSDNAEAIAATPIVSLLVQALYTAVHAAEDEAMQPEGVFFVLQL